MICLKLLRYFSFVLVFSALMLSPAAVRGEAAGYKDAIHITIAASPDTIDCGVSTAAVASLVGMGSIFETLTVIRGDYSIDLELAEDYKISEDAKTHTYVLRKGVKFHNGEEMKADDVVASLNRWIELSGTASGLLGGARFEKTDDYVVTLTLDNPFLYLNDLIATMTNRAIVVPKSILDKGEKPTSVLTELIGTGPYKFVEWAQDRYIHLTRFDDYKPYGTKDDYSGWGGYKEALTKDVYFDIVTEDSTRRAGLESGEYDITSLPYDEYERFSDDGGYKIHKLLEGDDVLVFNKREGIAAGAEFRQAVQSALNAEEILLAAFANPEFFDTDSSYIIPKDSEWYTTAGSQYYNVHDPDNTALLLKNAGYNGEPFRILVSSAYAHFYKAGVVIEQQLKAAGVNVELKVYDWATFMATRKEASQWDAFITSLPVALFPPFILSLDAGWAGWSEVEHLRNELRKITYASDKAEAIGRWQKLQEWLLAEYVPVCKYGNEFRLDISTSKVEGGSYMEGPHPWNIRVAE
jgi:peptide/nickel transport system substrate-binding protein